MSRPDDYADRPDLLNRLRGYLAGSWSERTAAPEQPPRIFIIHGHDTDLRDEVAGAVRGWVPTAQVQILESEPKRGRTVISALTQLLPEADFVIALATGDDLVRPRNHPRARPNLSARQNVIFELGATAMLNVRWMIIKDPGVVLPSDLAGVLYEPRDRWRSAILRELRDAGMPVDPDASA